jgi:SAM-dependent methyltransferase
MTFKEKIKQTLIDYSNKGLTDKAAGHSYEYAYPELLEKYETTENFTLLEVGTWKGHSLAIWSELFPNGTIYGSDNDYTPLEVEIKQFNNVILTPEGSQDEPETFKDLPKFDVIIDDASHQKDLTMSTFKILKSFLKKGGTYIIEDVNDWSEGGSYSEEFLKDFKRIDLREIKNRADDVVLVYTK